MLTSCRGRQPPCAHAAGPSGAQRSDQPSGRAPASEKAQRGAGEASGARAEHGALAPEPRRQGRARRSAAVSVWPRFDVAQRTASRRTVDGWPMCWWLPPPCGCSTGFIATPRTFGHEFRFTRYLWKARPAFSSGLSIRPPPATMPTAARARELTSFFCPDGRRRRVLPVVSMWPMICANPPEVRANLERSPGIFSTWLTTVPGGI